MVAELILDSGPSPGFFRSHWLLKNPIFLGDAFGLMWICASGAVTAVPLIN